MGHAITVVQWFALLGAAVTVAAIWYGVMVLTEFLRVSYHKIIRRFQQTEAQKNALAAATTNAQRK